MLSVTSAVLGAVVPDGAATPPGDFGNSVNELIGYAKWVGLGVCLLGLIGAACVLAISHQRHGDGSEAARVVRPLVAVSIISGAGSLVGLMA